MAWRSLITQATRYQPEEFGKVKTLLNEISTGNRLCCCSQKRFISRMALLRGLHPSVKSNTTFKDVKGAYYPKEKLKEIVGYLRDPECFARLGAMLPKGYLLAGPTGTGKTMLARAVAGETGVPFFPFNGREFETHFADDGFVTSRDAVTKCNLHFADGAQKMRHLFATARVLSPSIIFIDEIDQIHTKRTFNQLIFELDGLKQKSGVIVIAATNVPDSLDTALVKHGRFDRLVYVFKPNKQEKLEILESLMSKVPKANDVDLETIADETYKFSGADLANMVNHSALAAARDGAKVVTSCHMRSAMDEIRMAKGYPSEEEWDHITYGKVPEELDHLTDGSPLIDEC